MKRASRTFRFISSITLVFFTLTSANGLYAVTVGELTGNDSGSGAAAGSNDEFAGKQTNQYTEQQTPYKDPRLACLLSFIIPGGGGEFYLRKDVKAILFCLGTSLGYLAAVYFVLTGFVETEAGSSNFVIGTIAGLLGLVAHIFGMVEAYNDAVKINEAQFYRDY